MVILTITAPAHAQSQPKGCQMPNRYVRASAIESEPVNAVGWQAEVFWRRLLNRADDFGRFTGNLELIRASVFPLQLSKVSASDIKRLLKECEDAGLMFGYESEGKRCIIINKWEKGRASSSDYPAPPENICKRMKTFVYKCKQPQTNVPDSDPDSDPDSVADIPAGADGGEHGAFVEGWCQNYESAHKVKYQFIGGRDGKAVKELLKMNILRIDLLEIAKKAWALPDKFLNQRAKTVYGFLENFNAIQAAITVGVPAGQPSASMKAMLYSDELKAVQARKTSIKANYSEHQSWDEKHKVEFRELKAREQQLLALLGRKI